MNQLKSKKVTGFPNYFKKVGLFIIIFSIVFIILAGTFKFNFTEDYKPLVGELLFSAIIFGLIIIILANDKIQNEAALQLKLRAAFSALLFGAVFSIIWPLGDVIFSDYESDFNAKQLMLTMLFFYLFTYYTQRKQISK